MARDRDNVTGQLQSGHNFPNGMKALGDMIHSKKLKYGLYSDRGFKTCQVCCCACLLCAPCLLLCCSDCCPPARASPGCWTTRR